MTTKKKTLFQNIDDLLNDIQLPTDNEIKEETKNRKIGLANKGKDYKNTNIPIANRKKEQDIVFREKRAKNNADPNVRAKRKASMPDQTGENNPFFGKTHTEKTRKTISKKKKGCKAHNKGKKHTEDALVKMRKPRSEEGKANMRKPRTKMLTCPHCGKTGASGNMARYHMDNCKFK